MAEARFKEGILGDDGAMDKKPPVKAIIFDFNRTLYDPDSDALMPDALKVLKKLSNHFCLALHCKIGEGREQRISELGLKKFFKKVILVENKTAQDFTNAAAEFCIKPNEMLVVGDRIKSEITAAKAAGCKTIWFRNGKFAAELPSKPGEQPDFTIAKLEEVLEKIEVK